MYTFGKSKSAEIFASVVEEKGYKSWIHYSDSRVKVLHWHVEVTRILSTD